MRRFVLAPMVILVLGFATAQAEPINIVAAENFYGDVAEQVGGPAVKVTSILSNPDQDPHLFEASASTARDLAAARIVIYNGADYDPWMGKLLSASRATGRVTIEVAKLVGKKAGDNPHLWYDPATMPALAEALAAKFARLDPAHQADYVQRLARFQKSMQLLGERIAELRGKYSGTPVTATEPVFGYMAAALGLDMRNFAFQLAVMNDTEPGAAAIAAFEQDLRARTVKILLYNSQTSEALTRRMQKIATESGVPVVGVSETEPRGKDYQDWMLSQLDLLDRALAR